VLQNLASATLNLLYPERCVGCGTFNTSFCTPCSEALLPASGEGRCPNCTARWTGYGNCPLCFSWDALDGATAAVDMEGVARHLVHGLKYRWIRSLAPIIASHIAPLRAGHPLDLAIPVPLHRTRANDRGFNQAALILDALTWPQSEGQLIRNRKTRTQVGMHERARRRNVAGAFSYSGPRLDGLTVALVDDVITTGATANECARVLKDYGARRVIVIAFARANYESGTDHSIAD
jgi:ComF family protein